MFHKIIEFLRQVIQELRLTRRPSKQRTMRLTVVILIACVIIGGYIGLLDYGLTGLVSIFLS